MGINWIITQWTSFCFPVTIRFPPGPRLEKIITGIWGREMVPENPRKEGDGFAGDRRWDMEEREWSGFKLKRQLKGLNLEK